MNARLGWLLAALFAFAAWRAYDLAGLARGMTMLQIVTKTRSLGRKVEGSDDDWRWSDDGGASVVLHFEQGKLVRWGIERAPEPEVGTDPAA